MKKVLSIVLAIAMIATMSAVAFAGEAVINAVPDETTEIPVTATYAQGDRIDTYKVTISWEDFTYSFGSTETWNPTTHNWDLTAGAGEWTIEEKDITITNDSNKAVTASAAYEGEGTLDFGEAATVAAWNETAGTATLSATWAPAEGYTIQEATDLGTITVTIAAVA
ncbi:MAG: hypothetical protein IJO92_01740 [Clostridia bacterium]|nr:hypothetical protein [Clostridia bacterium]